MMEDEKTLEEGNSVISSEKHGTSKSNVAGELDDQILDVETQGVSTHFRRCGFGY
jgi:hypothetical protein